MLIFCQMTPRFFCIISVKFTVSQHCQDHRTYLASSIHLTTSADRQDLPRNRLAEGSCGTRWSRASSRRRTPTGCCKLARQPALTEAGSRLSKSGCWQLTSYETTNTWSYLAFGTLTIYLQVNNSFY